MPPTKRLILVAHVTHSLTRLPPDNQITVHGGNGVAIGSLGQYLEDSSVMNVIVKDANILINNNDMHNSAYIKTWVGELVPQDSYESDYLPRGGGW